MSMLLYNLALCYEFGKDIPIDISEAVILYWRASEKGHHLARVRLEYHQKNKVRRLFNLARNFEEGNNSIPWDERQAAILYQQAADVGFGPAIYRLGKCYEEGCGIPQDYEQAVSLYKQAVEKGSPDAMYRLALCYEEGHGISKDDDEAIILYRKAAKKGHSKAIDELQLRGSIIDSSVDE